MKEAEELVEKLSHDLTTVQTALAIANDTVKARDDNDQQSATVEHDALVKAKADLEAIRIETELLTAAHNVALQQSTTRIAELEAHAASLETATQELNENLQKLKKEKDDALAKLSELEVEVLELKEQVETNEHDGARQVSDMKAMHTAEIQSIREDLESKLGKAVEANTEAAAKWEEATKAAQENHSATLESAVKEAEDTADRASQEALKALIDGHVASLSEKDATFKQLLEEAEKKYEEKTEGLTAQVKALTVELEVWFPLFMFVEKETHCVFVFKGQEAHYNVKLTGAQNEHATLLQKAFSDAKVRVSCCWMIRHIFTILPFRPKLAVFMRRICQPFAPSPKQPSSKFELLTRTKSSLSKPPTTHPSRPRSTPSARSYRTSSSSSVQPGKTSLKLKPRLSRPRRRLHR